MKKGKYKLTVYSDDKNVLENFHSFMVNDGTNHCLIYDEYGDGLYYADIDWDTENQNNLDLSINCDYTVEYE